MPKELESAVSAAIEKANVGSISDWDLLEAAVLNAILAERERCIQKIIDEETVYGISYPDMTVDEEFLRRLLA